MIFQTNFYKICLLYLETLQLLSCMDQKEPFIFFKKKPNICLFQNIVSDKILLNSREVCGVFVSIDSMKFMVPLMSIDSLKFGKKRSSLLTWVG